MGICNSIYDPLGITSPFTIGLKILIKETLDVNNPSDWNSPVSSHLIDEWGEAISEGITVDMLQFLQSCRPPNAAKLPRLVSFFNGSS